MKARDWNHAGAGSIRLSGLIVALSCMSAGIGCVVSCAGPQVESGSSATIAVAEETQSAPVPDPSEGAEAPPAGPWSPPAEAVMEGIDGAGQALARGDFESALERAQAVTAAPGTKEWFRQGAILGRVLLDDDNQENRDPAAAVEALKARVEHDDLENYFPPELLGFELCKAEYAWARANDGSLSEAEVDAMLRGTSSRLSKLRKRKTNRHEAAMRLLQARVLGAIPGIDASKKNGRYWAGTTAVKAIDRFLTDYPNAAAVGELRLLRAENLIKAGKRDDAAASLRALAIDRAGEPEAEQAWTRLGQLAAEDEDVERDEWRPQENLARAENARELRRVERSRAILDEMLADESLSDGWKRRARRMRAHTAYRERDYTTCVDDLLPSYEEHHNVDTRHYLTRCMERAGRYDELLALWDEIADSRVGWGEANAVWEGLEQAFKAGRYTKALALLERYEKKYRGRIPERRFYRAWINYRLGDTEAAIEGFKSLERLSNREVMARYFRGKLQLKSADPALRDEGIELLEALWDVAAQDLVAKGPRGGTPLYYGLWARQRLIESGHTPKTEVPKLAPLEDSDRSIGYAQTRSLFEASVPQWGKPMPALARAGQLHGAGWMEEARRELRIAADQYINGKKRIAGGDVSVARTESYVQGIGWRAEWSYPKPMPSKEARAVLRSEEDSERLRVALRELTIALEEPNRAGKLTPWESLSYRSRWHPRAFRAAIEREAHARGIDPMHLWALMYTESRFRRHVVSYVGARGALQIMPWTGRQLEERLGTLEVGQAFDPDVLYDTDHNAKLAAYYVAELFSKFHGQAPMAYASYNGGPSNVQRWLEAKGTQDPAAQPLETDDFVEEIPFTESNRYARRVMEVHAAYSLMYTGELPTWRTTTDTEVEDNIAF